LSTLAANGRPVDNAVATISSRLGARASDAALIDLTAGLAANVGIRRR
jgi:hypothetical protein